MGIEGSRRRRRVGSQDVGGRHAVDAGQPVEAVDGEAPLTPLVGAERRLLELSARRLLDGDERHAPLLARPPEPLSDLSVEFELVVQRDSSFAAPQSRRSTPRTISEPGAGAVPPYIPQLLKILATGTDFSNGNVVSQKSLRKI
jgi:hypothetical protein